MRLLMFHVDRFVATVTDRGRTRLIEPQPEGPIVLDEGLLVLANVEADDERDPAGVAAEGARLIGDLAAQLKAPRALVLPFAHLFGQPGDPAAAVALLDDLVARLRAAGLEARRVPFGWFFAWDLRAKGHPLSRVARSVVAGRGAA